MGIESCGEHPPMYRRAGKNPGTFNHRKRGMARNEEPESVMLLLCDVYYSPRVCVQDCRSLASFRLASRAPFSIELEFLDARDYSIQSGQSLFSTRQ